jgi:hypothetical protein
MLRRYFLYDRKLLTGLSRFAWESLKIFIQDVVPENNPIPGAVIAVQTFGDFLGFNPDCHILVTNAILSIDTSKGIRYFFHEQVNIVTNDTCPTFKHHSS